MNQPDLHAGRRRVMGWTVAAMALISLAASPLGAQAPAAKAPAKTAKAWTAPKTPWGDPDIQGVWTSDSVRGIPTQRPAELAGKAELSEEEYGKKVARDEQTRKQAENAEGAFRNDGAWLLKSFRQTSLITEPADGRFPPLTPDAQKRAATRDRGSFGEGPFHGPEDFTLYDRCITRGIVGSILPVVYGNGNRILQTPKEVVISYEMVHDTRIIPLDGRPHVGQKIRQYLGDSRGRWEGNTLVVETTNLSDQTSIGANGNGLRHSAEMKIVERFTRSDADVLQYEVAVEDPKTYTRPFKMSIPLISPPGFQLLPYECHEGNYMLQNVLSGERTEDKALEEDLKKGIVRPRKGVQQGLDAGARPLPTTQGGEGGPAR